jgi:lipopolysaccharide transport system ATP-binding protein
MSSDVAIRAEGLGKAFTISHQATDSVTLTEALLDRVRHPLRRREREQFWALRDLTFDIKAGNVVGLIGRNGSGKSTLLKVLTKITPPTTGRADLRGRVGSLLEVGTGFHQELTGRENIYLNGAILGMNRPEIARAFDSIVDFAGVSQFLDTPVKRYSTGMYVRLAFAVAAHLSTEILFVDEVLAVGDAAFQQRCLGTMRDAADAGRTVIFVSHQMSAIATLCNEAFYLENGQLSYVGATEGAIERYMASYRQQTDDPESATGHRSGRGEWRITAARATQPAFATNEDKNVEFTAHRFTDHVIGFYAWANIVDETGTLVARCDTRLSGVTVQPGVTDATLRLTVRSPWMRPGRYFVDLYLGNFGTFDGFERACTFEVLPLLPYAYTAESDALDGGVVLPDFHYEVIAAEHH